jgi:hypothetical protein
VLQGQGQALVQIQVKPLEEKGEKPLRVSQARPVVEDALNGLKGNTHPRGQRRTRNRLPLSQ